MIVPFSMKIEVSNGELIDKLTILEIKSVKITDPKKLVNIRKELLLLKESALSILSLCIEETKELKRVNEKLWKIEDQIRLLEAQKTFDLEFVELARSVYLQNDDRAAIKKRINIKTNSSLSEEKSYQSY